MAAGSARLDSAHVQDRGFEVDLIPAQVHQLSCPQAVSVSDQDHGGVALTPAVAPGGGHKFLNLALRQVLASAQVAIGAPPGCNCSFYDSWRDQLELPFCHVFGPPSLAYWSYNASFLNSARKLSTKV